VKARKIEDKVSTEREARRQGKERNRLEKEKKCNE
jgi:hypothetical protein